MPAYLVLSELKQHRLQPPHQYYLLSLTVLAFRANTMLCKKNVCVASLSRLKRILQEKNLRLQRPQTSAVLHCKLQAYTSVDVDGTAPISQYLLHDFSFFCGICPSVVPTFLQTESFEVWHIAAEHEHFLDCYVHVS